MSITMVRKTVRIRMSQKEYIDDSPYQLSKLSRNALDEVLGGERDYPMGQDRRSTHREYQRTTVMIDDDHEEFIQENGMNFSQFVDDTINQRIRIERKIGDLDTEE